MQTHDPKHRTSEQLLEEEDRAQQYYRWFGRFPPVSHYLNPDIVREAELHWNIQQGELLRFQSNPDIPKELIDAWIKLGKQWAVNNLKAEFHTGEKKLLNDAILRKAEATREQLRGLNQKKPETTRSVFEEKKVEKPPVIEISETEESQGGFEIPGGLTPSQASQSSLSIPPEMEHLLAQPAPPVAPPVVPEEEPSQLSMSQPSQDISGLSEEKVLAEIKEAAKSMYRSSAAPAPAPAPAAPVPSLPSIPEARVAPVVEHTFLSENEPHNLFPFRAQIEQKQDPWAPRTPAGRISNKQKNLFEVGNPFTSDIVPSAVFLNEFDNPVVFAQHFKPNVSMDDALEYLYDAVERGEWDTSFSSSMEEWFNGLILEPSNSSLFARMWGSTGFSRLFTCVPLDKRSPITRITHEMRKHISQCLLQALATVVRSGSETIKSPVGLRVCADYILLSQIFSLTNYTAEDTTALDLLEDFFGFEAVDKSYHSVVRWLKTPGASQPKVLSKVAFPPAATAQRKQTMLLIMEIFDRCNENEAITRMVASKSLAEGEKQYHYWIRVAIVAHFRRRMWRKMLHLPATPPDIPRSLSRLHEAKMYRERNEALEEACKRLSGMEVPEEKREEIPEEKRVEVPAPAPVQEERKQREEKAMTDMDAALDLLEEEEEEEERARAARKSHRALEPEVAPAPVSTVRKRAVEKPLPAAPPPKPSPPPREEKKMEPEMSPTQRYSPSQSTQAPPSQSSESSLGGSPFRFSQVPTLRTSPSQSLSLELHQPSQEVEEPMEVEPEERKHMRSEIFWFTQAHPSRFAGPEDDHSEDVDIHSCGFKRTFYKSALELIQDKAVECCEKATRLTQQAHDEIVECCNELIDETNRIYDLVNYLERKDHSEPERQEEPEERQEEEQEEREEEPEEEEEEREIRREQGQARKRRGERGKAREYPNLISQVGSEGTQGTQSTVLRRGKKIKKRRVAPP
jgi:hypothetical protein